MDDITDDELAAMEAREKAATEGPWQYDAEWERVQTVAIENSGVDGNGHAWEVHKTIADMSFDGAAPNAEFIAHTRTDVPRLLRALRAARNADDPVLDATDGAHPAWWRGHDHVAAKMRDALEYARVDRDDVGVRLDAAHAQLSATEEERDALRAENDALKAKLAAWEPDMMMSAIRRGPVMGSPFICCGCNESRLYTGEFCACGYCKGCPGCVCPNTPPL